MALASLARKFSLVADADDEGRAAPRADDLAGMLAADDGDAVSADDLAQGVAHGLGEGTRLAVGAGLALVIVANQMGQHLGVGGGVKGVAGLEEPFLETVAILNHAVVDEGDGAGLVQVGVGILIGGRAVGGPAGMADAELAGDGLVVDEAGQALIQFAYFFANGQTAFREHGEARAVVAAILQAPQRFQQNGRRCFLTDVSDDAAHGSLALP